MPTIATEFWPSTDADHGTPARIEVEDNGPHMVAIHSHGTTTTTHYLQRDSAVALANDLLQATGRR